ncbi:unnamed protein product [Cuscuta campestris]|uniref:Uncharacterized protein n=1 Tax=Cuscuta campestris TaxID=132261 RepID=A0A484LR73_9ASTE|nr:unnamed protein product [Cuscuta campestris]
MAMDSPVSSDPLYVRAASSHFLQNCRREGLDLPEGDEIQNGVVVLRAVPGSEEGGEEEGGDGISAAGSLEEHLKAVDAAGASAAEGIGKDRAVGEGGFDECVVGGEGVGVGDHGGPAMGIARGVGP